MHDFEGRCRRLLALLEGRQLDGLLVTHPAHLRYLFGFSGSTAAALCTPQESWLLVDSRYTEQAQEQTVGCRVRDSKTGPIEGLQVLLEEKNYGSKHRLGFESSYLTHQQLSQLKSWNNTPRWAAASGLIESLRQVKEESELELLEQAFRIARRAFDLLIPRLEPGMTELEAAGWLELEMRRGGGEGVAFDTIIASGERSSLPHGVASPREIGAGEIVLVDFGTRFQGYNSDMTRVYCPPDSRPEIYGIVEEAQQRALDAVRPGESGRQVDGAARSVIEKAGYGAYFGHGCGHGLGLEVHESPRLTPRFDQVLEPGMVFTVEPGIYLPGQYGVRLEDVVVVTGTGYRFLSR